MPRIRRARPIEASALAALAVRSKAHWGYPPDFLTRFAETLGLTEQVVAENEVWVIERDSAVRGFVTLLLRTDLVVLDDLWLEPDEIGRGSGRVLFEHAVARTVEAGRSVLEWHADPNAVGFYERMGGTVVGSAEGQGRRLPVMRLHVG